VSRTVKCEYCGNQRSEQARAQGLAEGQYDDLLNFEKSERLGEREKAALAYAEAITWRLESTDGSFRRRCSCPVRRTPAPRPPHLQAR
jgi:alkylhydroperoxidase family enzyme